MMMAFHVGQKVTMKAPHVWHGDPHPAQSVLPVFGEVYTIAEIDSHQGDAFIGLYECDYFGRFLADWFRPVKTTDIAVFRRMLAPKPVKTRKTEKA